MNNTVILRIVDAAEWRKEFETFEEVINFFRTEYEFWEKKRSNAVQSQDDLHPILLASRRLGTVLKRLGDWKDIAEHWDAKKWQAQFRTLKNDFDQLQRAWIWSGHPFTLQFLECHFEYGKDAAVGFLQFLLGHKRNDADVCQEVGRLVAYEYVSQDSKISSRAQSEKDSFKQVRSQIDLATKKIIKDADDAISRFDKRVKKSYGYSWRLNLKAAKFAKKIAVKNEGVFGGLIDEIKEQRDGSARRQKELEQTFQNKLRLEKPAQYWKSAARNHKIQAEKWSFWLVFTAALGIGFFVVFFMTWLSGIKIGIKFSTIEGAVLFASILAGYAFLIRTFSRLAFSSYHLMRDCEEREQLTYLYLALVKDGDLGDDSLGIVLQSLFSRSDSGLLSSDSGPTMPGGLSELIKMSGK